MHLLENAGKYSPNGGSIKVTSEVKGDKVVTSIADRGPGIDSFEQSLIFEKFYRAPGAATGGTGLGLSLAKGFVEIQGGGVHAENRLGGGAVFTISLPLAHSA